MKREQNIGFEQKRQGLRNKFLLVLLLVPIIIISGCGEQDGWEIQGDSIIQDDANIYLEITPHTITSSGWIEAEFKSKVFEGDIDFVFGFDTSQAKPTESQLYNPRNVTYDYTCSYDFVYTQDPNYFWCYQNYTNGNGTGYNITYFEHSFDGGNPATGYAWWNEWEEWMNWNPTTKYEYDYADMNTWYYAKNQHINADTTYKIRYYLSVPSGSSGKYTLALKPSSETIEEAIANGHFYMLDPWWDTSPNWLLVDLTHYYTFEEGLNDSANGTNGSCANCPTYDVGKIGTGAEFGGVNHYFDTTNREYDDESNFTIAMWVNYTSDSGQNEGFFGYLQADPDRMRCFQGDGGSNGGVQCEVHGGTSIATGYTNTSYGDSDWHYIIMTWNGSMLRLFVDNVEVINKSGTPGDFNNSANMRIAQVNGQADFYDGRIDEIGVWHTILNQSHMDALYNNSNGLGFTHFDSGVSIPPGSVNMSLNTPINESSFDYNSFVNFTWLINSSSSIDACYLSVNTTTYTNDTNLAGGTNIEGGYGVRFNGTSYGDFLWNVTCVDTGSASGESGIFNISVGTPNIPSTPTTLTDNHSYYFNTPTLSCNGSTDMDGDTINIEFLGNDSNIMYNSTATTFQWDNITIGIWNWSCRACDIGGCGNASQSQLYMMNFTNCTSPNNENLSINFTIWDEENTSSALVADWGATFELSTLTGDVRDYTFNLDNYSSLSFCLMGGANTSQATIDNFIEWDPTNISYSFPRQYYFNGETININTTTHIQVFSLVDGLSTAVTFFVTEEGTTPVENEIIRLERYYPETDTYEVAGMGQTAANGKDIIYLRLTDAFYRVRAYDQDGNLEFSSGPEHITSATYNIILGGGGVGDIDYSELEQEFDFDNAVWSLAWDNITNTSYLNVSDATDYITMSCLRVQKYVTQAPGITIECEDCASGSTVSLTCPVNTTSGLFVLKFLAYHNPNWKLMDTLEVDLATQIDELIGLDGVFLALLLIGLMFFIGLHNPVASIILGLIGFIFSVALGLITISWAAIIGIVFVGLLLLFKRKGT